MKFINIIKFILFKMKKADSQQALGNKNEGGKTSEFL